MKNEIDTYIAGFPEQTKKLLEQMRKTIRQAAPRAVEVMKYGIPTFTLHGNLVHFAGYKNHIGFYPAPSGIKTFKKELSRYKGAKGSVQFPLDEPLPLGLVSKIVKFRVKENQEKTGIKSSDSKSSENLFASLPAPARRALINNGIRTTKQLSKLSESEVMAFHGMGKSSLPKLRKALADVGLDFKN